MTTATMATVTRFRQRYDAGEVPARVAHGGGANAIAWRVDPAALDARVYLPLFIDGVRETTHPYRVLAVRGGIELTRACGERALLETLPRCALPLRDALNTGDPAVIAVTLELLVEFTRASPAMGEALVPYYRQLLPRLNALKDVDDVYVSLAPRRRALVARASTSRERGRGRERRERNAPSRDRTHRSRTIQTQHRQSGASRASRARAQRRRRRVGQHQISHSHVPFVRARRVSVHTSRASLKYSILHHRSRRRRLSLTVSLSLGLSRARPDPTVPSMHQSSSFRHSLSRARRRPRASREGDDANKRVGRYRIARCARCPRARR